MIQKIWKHLVKICEHRDENLIKNAKINSRILLEMFANLKFCKKLDEILLKFCEWSGAKEYQSDRSRQEFSNEYFLAKFGVDTEESEPYKICFFGGKIREMFDIEPFN